MLFLLRFACVHISHFCILPFAFSLLPFTYVPNDDVLASLQSVYCLELLAIGLLWAALMVNARKWLNVFCNYFRQITFKFKPAFFYKMLASDNHGLCGSNKLLHKRCAKSMGRPKFRPPQLPHFSTDLNETWNQESYLESDPTRKIRLMWDDGKGVCGGREFSVTFCVPAIFVFLYSCPRLQVTPKNRSRPLMAQSPCFRVR